MRTVFRYQQPLRTYSSYNVHVLQTGRLWMKQSEHEMAEGCFAAAIAHTASLTEACSSTALPDARRQQLVDLMSDLYTGRAQAAWALQQEVCSLERILQMQTIVPNRICMHVISLWI